jgi:hypothetical protein
VDNFDGLRWGDDSSIAVRASGQALAAELTTCHRSDEAGAPKAHHLLKGLYPGMKFVLGFVACSGAATRDLMHAGYTGPGTLEASLLDFDRVPQPAQITRVRQLKDDNAGQLDAVYMSIGGNDIGFGDIVSDCVDPTVNDLLGGCKSVWEPLLPDRADALAASYVDLDGAIQGALRDSGRPRVPVLITDYPNPLDNGVAIEDPPVCRPSDYDAHGEAGLPGTYDDFVRNNVTAEEAVFAFGLSAVMNAVPRPSSWTALLPPDFRGHGICTALPFANLNSRALRRQGHDLAGTAPFLVSAGFLHPNDDGYTAYADVLVPALRPLVDARVLTGLQPPTGLRIGAFDRSTGILTVQWNDRSTAESSYAVEVTAARPQDEPFIGLVPVGSVHLGNGGYIANLDGSGVQQFAHGASFGSKAMFRYRVRACNSGVAGTHCGPFSDPLVGANLAPVTPAGLSRTVVRLALGGTGSRYSWSPVDGAIEYVVRIPGDSSGTEHRTTATSLTFADTATTLGANSSQIAACNQAGCSFYSAKVPF